jgi:hypothetical protein
MNDTWTEREVAEIAHTAAALPEALTLEELARRLNSVVERNRAKGLAHRNKLPVMVTVVRGPRAKTRAPLTASLAGSLFKVGDAAVAELRADARIDVAQRTARKPLALEA